ncbi:MULTISPECIES: hypothetical protein [unclassified Kribbella]|uniref:hypothetical protein n=1 Tax=unclassified Kribbella TaxID=2644121 RepID=UPI0033C01936
MPLNEVAGSLDHAVDDLRLPVQRQLDQVSQRISAQQHLRRRLEAILRAMQQARDPSKRS